MSTPLKHRGRMRRVVAATASSMVVIALTAGAVFAWVRPTLTAACADDESHFSWNINLSQEADYQIQFSWSSNFASPWLVNFGSPGDHEFVTDRGGSTLYARWMSDQSKSTSGGANDELCVPKATPTPTPTAHADAVSDAHADPGQFGPRTADA